MDKKKTEIQEEKSKNKAMEAALHISKQEKILKDKLKTEGAKASLQRAKTAKASAEISKKAQQTEKAAEKKAKANDKIAAQKEKAEAQKSISKAKIDASKEVKAAAAKKSADSKAEKTLQKAKDQELKTKTKAANEKVKNAKMKAAISKNKAIHQAQPQQPAGLDPETLSTVVVNAVIEGMNKMKEVENMNDDNAPAKRVANEMISDAKKQATRDKIRAAKECAKAKSKKHIAETQAKQQRMTKQMMKDEERKDELERKRRARDI